MKIRSLMLISSVMAACATPPEVSTDLRLDRPFGQSWDPSAAVMAAYGEMHDEQCAAVFDPSVEPADFDWCVEESPSEVALPPEMVPQRFRDGGVTVYLGDDEPRAFKFLFAPWFASFPEANRPDGAAVRKERADRLGAELTGLLGPSDVRLDLGFSGLAAADDGSCQLWLREPVGVILCKDTATTPDAGGMLLVFVRVDRSRLGPELREIATSLN